MLKLNSCLVRLGTLHLIRRSSSSAQAVDSAVKRVIDAQDDDSKIGNSIHKPTGLVAAAFNNLKNDGQDMSLTDTDSLKKSGSLSIFEVRKQVEDKINKATNVESLLSLVDVEVLSRKQMFKIVSILSLWASSDKIKVSDFENDPKFMKLCRILSRTKLSTDKNFNTAIAAKTSEDLNTVISVAGDDEAARLVASLNDQQMIKVVSTLAQKKRRSPTLLRTLSYHITKSPNALNLKNCSDLFYALASLNYPDEVLIDKITSDIQEKLPENKDKSSVLGSIATSLGMLRCKEREILELFTDWMVEYKDVTRTQDVAALVMTMAVVGCKTINADKLPKLTEVDFSKAGIYLDYVWSLVVLDLVTPAHLSSVLDKDFDNKLKIDQVVPSHMMKKLLNINSYAILLMTGYNGPFLEDTLQHNITLSYSKEKQQFIASLLDTLKSLMSSEANLKTSCDSKMGFLYDAECLLDSKCNPYPVNSKPTKGKVLTKISMLGLEYHDMCRQTSDPVGSIDLYKRLLEAKGYKVLLVPYTEYNSRDKLVNRVQYVERKLKEIVQCDTSRLK